MPFGRELRAERERLGSSLEEVAEGTRIQLHYLRAIEADDFATLPGGVFNKGFVRSYCRHLGLDENAWLARFESTSSATDSEADWATFAENVRRSRVQAGSGMGRRWWGVLLMLLALGALGWAVWRYAVKPRMHLRQTAVVQTAYRGPHHSGGLGTVQGRISTTG